MKLIFKYAAIVKEIQPPSGGCVLKQHGSGTLLRFVAPAAFRRLCVETKTKTSKTMIKNPAAFRRLCVETRK